MKAKQYYDCFPDYAYNTAFGSLLTGPTGSDDHVRVCNNSAWEMDCNARKQSIAETVKLLIDFLDEFLIFLSRMTEFQPSQKIVDMAERIHQHRSTLLVQINHHNDDVNNSSTTRNISSICLILHELASFIRSLCKEQQQQSLGGMTNPSQTTTLTELSDRIERMIKSCMNCVNIPRNSQCYQRSTPVSHPCSNFPPMADVSVLSTGCALPCDEPNICMPWSCFEGNRIFGLMYGIKDKNVRRKLGYKSGKRRSTKRRKHKYKRNIFPKKKERSFTSDRDWIVSSTDSEISPVQSASDVSIREKLDTNDQKEIERQSKRKSKNSIISQMKNSLNRLGSSRTPSRQPSSVNSQQSSPLFRTKSDINKSIKSRSAHSTRPTTPHTGEFPITSMLDRSVSQRTPSGLIQQQQQSSEIYQNDDAKSTRSLSIRNYGYQTPSKTTIRVSRESSPSSTSVPSKSVHTHQSNIFTLSPKTSSKRNIQQKKSTPSVTKKDSKRSSKKTIHQNSSIHQSNIGNTISTVMMPSNQGWQQSLGSPSSIASTQSIHSTHLSENIRSPISSKQFSLNEPTIDSHFNLYSEHQLSPSTSSVNHSPNNRSVLNMVERSQSAEGEKTTKNPSKIIYKKDTSTPQFSSTNTYRQQSTSATGDHMNLLLLSKTGKHASRPIRDRKTKFYVDERVNSQGYFHKLMNCFRRMNIDRSKYEKKSFSNH